MPVSITIQVEETVKARLDEAATHNGLNPEQMAVQILSEGLDPVQLTDWQETEVRAAMKEVERDGTIPEAEVFAWLHSLGTQHELPRPQPRLRVTA